MSSNTGTVVSVMATFVVLNFVTIALRLWVRQGSRGMFGYDDAMIVVAYLTFVVFCSFEFVAIHYGYAATDVKPQYDSQIAIKYFTLAMSVYIGSLALTKLSIGLVLYRIAETMKGVRKFILVVMVVSSIWSLAVLVIFSIQCRPLAFTWGGAPEGTCLSPKTLSNAANALSAMDIASGAIFGLMPVYLLWGVQLSWRVKGPIVLLMAIGMLSNVATMLRLKFLVDISKATSATAPSTLALFASTLVYTCLDLALTIFTASLVALRPLLKYIPFLRSSVSDSGPSRPPAHSGSGSKNTHLKTFGSTPQRAIRLDDLDADGDSSDGKDHHGRHPTESQENMLHGLGKEGIIVKQQVKVEIQDRP